MASIRNDTQADLCVMTYRSGISDRRINRSTNENKLLQNENKLLRKSWHTRYTEGSIAS